MSGCICGGNPTLGGAFGSTSTCPIHGGCGGQASVLDVVMTVRPWERLSPSPSNVDNILDALERRLKAKFPQIFGGA